MKIISLEHNQIDKKRWDDCIRQARNRRIYAWSWYLDIVCPGWNAMVSDDYRMVFPLTRNRKYGINYLFQPFFTQQSGVFSNEKITKEISDRFLLSLPVKYRYIDIHLNSGMEINSEKWAVVYRINHELSLEPTYSEIISQYHQNTKRNIKKAGSSELVFDNSVAVSELILLFRNTFGKKEGLLNSDHYMRLETLLNELIFVRKGFIQGIRDKSGNLMAGACFVNDENRWYYLFAASDPAARENGAMSLLIDNFISEHAGKASILDFEGGNDPQLGRFYKGFGAEEVIYPAIRMNRFPEPFRCIISFLKKESHSGKKVLL